jgi:hypothetical protein
MAIEHTSTHEADAVTRLAYQFHEKARFEALIGAFGARAQTVEDALWKFVTLRGIDTATGSQLDNLGAIVGESREGKSDDTYRIFIRARVRLNRGSGTGEDIIAIYALILSALSGNTFSLKEIPPAAFILRIYNALTTANTLSLVRILRQARAAGVRGLLEWSSVTDDNAFEFGTDQGDGHGERIVAQGFADYSTPTVGGILAGVLE